MRNRLDCDCSSHNFVWCHYPRTKRSHLLMNSWLLTQVSGSMIWFCYPSFFPIEYRLIIIIIALSEGLLTIIVIFVLVILSLYCKLSIWKIAAISFANIKFPFTVGLYLVDLIWDVPNSINLTKDLPPLKGQNYFLHYFFLILLYEPNSYVIRVSDIAGTDVISLTDM